MVKLRFTGLDTSACVFEAQCLVGMKVVEIFESDQGAYLFILEHSDKRAMLLMEAGVRFHITSGEFTQNSLLSDFSMKLRKHVLNRDIKSIRQLGTKATVDVEILSKTVLYHIIVELKFGGNIFLTNGDYLIKKSLKAHPEPM
uniref:Uncharacterized protein n=1 Tax=Rhodnius prolixus TaxID=13249 RepID=T1I863_RHOPR